MCKRSSATVSRRRRRCTIAASGGSREAWSSGSPSDPPLVVSSGRAAARSSAGSYRYVSGPAPRWVPPGRAFGRSRLGWAVLKLPLSARTLVRARVRGRLVKISGSGSGEDVGRVPEVDRRREAWRVIITFIAMQSPDSRSLVPRSVVRTGALARAGGAAVFASDEFFSARIRNPHTRRAYGRAVSRFLAWVEEARRGPGAGDAGDGGPVYRHAQWRTGGEATGALGLPAVLHRVGPATRDDPQSVRLGHRRAVSGDRGPHAGDHHLASPRVAGGVRDRVARGPPRSGAVRDALLHRRADRRGAGASVRRSGGIGAAAAGEGREATHHSGPRGSPRLAPGVGRGGGHRVSRRAPVSRRGGRARRRNRPRAGGFPRTRRAAS